jgi:hypothetical protein
MFLILSAGVILGWLLHGSFSKTRISTLAKQGLIAEQKIV